jgi:hypothetical protein
MGNNKFVFVVCGERKHMDSLHIAICALQAQTNNDIIVLTDSTRNEIPVNHSKVINVPTPPAYNNHQASIYLKTGLHKFLPNKNNYCYLDSDIIAVNRDVDKIFEAFCAPISFAPDYSPLLEFSKHAVNCGCKQIDENEYLELKAILEKYDLFEEPSEEAKAKESRLSAYLDELKSRKLLYKFIELKYSFSGDRFTLKNYIYNKSTKTWYDKASKEVVLRDFPFIIGKIEEESRFKYNWDKAIWLNEEGKEVQGTSTCKHLLEEINRTFHIDNIPDDWQHWNGGVFVFNDSSKAFLDKWHQNSLMLFDLPAWKTRDQGSLIATVWQFGLADHPMLDVKWNFIASYLNDGLAFDEQGNFTDNNWVRTVPANFVHVIQHFGDEKWDFWNHIIKQSNE